MDAELAEPLVGRSVGDGGGSFVIAEWRAEGGPAGPIRTIAPLHLHEEDDEAWYVLEGTLMVRLGERVVEARAGSAVMAPRGVAHTYWNPGTETARYLLVMTPRIRELIAAIHELTERNPETLRAVFRRYKSELLG